MMQRSYALHARRARSQWCDMVSQSAATPAGGRRYNDSAHKEHPHGGTLMLVAITTRPAFRAGPPVRLLAGEGCRGSGTGGSAPTCEVGKDGRFLMLKDAEPADPSCVLVLNWAAELSRLLPR
jgi:hypothetical protein